jgi:FAD-linked oxidoreductase
MSKRLRNWTGDLRWRPARIDHPTTHKELVAAVRSTDLPIRVLGAGHSFTPLAATDQHAIRLDGLSGLELVDPERQEVTVWAGTRLRDLGPRLAEHGLAIENQGDIDAQALAGTLSTATHGTGARLGCIASQALGLTLVTATGDTLVLTRNHDGARFLAAAVSLGCLGVVSQVRLKVRAAYRLCDVRRTLPLDECLAQIDATAAAHRHFEFFWFPYSDLALTKTLDIVDEGSSRKDKSRAWLTNMVLDNLGLWLSCQFCRVVPKWTPALNGFCARTMDESEYLGPAHRIFPTPRLVRFHEMEYAVPAARGPDCLREIRAFIADRKLPVSFPLEYRLVAKDDLFLSPFYERDSATVSVHMFHPVAYRELFDGVEAIFQNHAGRPHWGKKHSARPPYLRGLYPHWDDFLQIRAELDPTGRFLNPHLRAVFLDATG